MTSAVFEDPDGWTHDTKYYTYTWSHGEEKVEITDFKSYAYYIGEYNELVTSLSFSSNTEAAQILTKECYDMSSSGGFSTYLYDKAFYKK